MLVWVVYPWVSVVLSWPKVCNQCFDMRVSAWSPRVGFLAWLDSVVCPMHETVIHGFCCSLFVYIEQETKNDGFRWLWARS